MSTYWGIDLGGTKIEGVVLRSLEDPPQPLARLRIQTEANRGYQHILNRISELVGRLSEETGEKPAIIGIGHPGSEDPKTLLFKNSNTQCLNGQALRVDLAEQLGCEVAAANDANCFALAESCFGAGRGARVVFGVIMGTGVGGGIVVDGRVVHGAQGIAGEWGHNVLLPDGAQCYCGKRGCIETLISGPAVERYFEGRGGRRLPLAEVAALEETGEEAAAETIEQLCLHFGQAIAQVINILDPEVIVLGGGVSNVEALYTRGRAHAARYVFNNRFETPFARNYLGDSAGVFGAALLTRGEVSPKTK